MLLIDRHTHADHFSATRELARQLEVPVACPVKAGGNP
jgi:glyoxylase-like metal-dependent hydrolase (beta-lactamase superfamily II)